MIVARDETIASPKLSVVIVTRNVRRMLHDCLVSLFEDLQQGPSAEVFVVDNASNDGSATMVRETFPQVTLIANEKDLGFATGNNIGFARCIGTYVMMLNSDTIVHKGAMSLLARYLDEHPRVGMVGPRLVNPDGSTQRSCWKLPTLDRVFFEALLLDAAFRRNPRVGNYEDWRHDRERTIEFIVSAAVLFRRRLLDDLGPLDTGYFMFGDDYDWSRRLRDAGWLTRYYPAAEITHYGGQSTSAVAPVASIVEATRSKDRYYRKFYGRGGYAFYKVCSVVGCMLRIALLSVSWRLSPKNRSAGKNVTRSRYVAQLRYHLRLGDRSGLLAARQ